MTTTTASKITNKTKSDLRFFPLCGVWMWCPHRFLCLNTQIVVHWGGCGTIRRYTGKEEATGLSRSLFLPSSSLSLSSLPLSPHLPAGPHDPAALPSLSWEALSLWNNCNPKANPFFSKLLFVRVFHHSNGKVTYTPTLNNRGPPLAKHRQKWSITITLLSKIHKQVILGFVLFY